MARIVLHWDALGNLHFLQEAGVEVVCVDERVPHDRVYVSTQQHTPEVLDAVIAGADPIDTLNEQASRHAPENEDGTLDLSNLQLVHTENGR